MNKCAADKAYLKSHTCTSAFQSRLHLLNSSMVDPWLFWCYYPGVLGIQEYKGTAEGSSEAVQWLEKPVLRQASVAAGNVHKHFALTLKVKQHLILGEGLVCSWLHGVEYGLPLLHVKHALPKSIYHTSSSLHGRSQILPVGCQKMEKVEQLEFPLTVDCYEIWPISAQLFHSGMFSVQVCSKLLTYFSIHDGFLPSTSMKNLEKSLKGSWLLFVPSLTFIVRIIPWLVH